MTSTPWWSIHALRENNLYRTRIKRDHLLDIFSVTTMRKISLSSCFRDGIEPNMASAHAVCTGKTAGWEWFPTAYANRVLSRSRKRLPSWIVLSQRPTSRPSGELRKTCSEGKEVPGRSFREREKVPAWMVLPCTNDSSEKIDESCDCVTVEICETH